ncbi:MAG: 30S ribosomal protein S16 [Proteobacteria bacterium]|nr:30S ribosomal protein S16 [Pseudomonadota bacterium]
MAVAIRLARFGGKKRPTYRIVVADSRAPRDGKFIENIGIYDPNQNPALIRIEDDKAIDWMRKGAQPSETVRKLMEKSGLFQKMAEGKES